MSKQLSFVEADGRRLGALVRQAVKEARALVGPDVSLDKRFIVARDGSPVGVAVWDAGVRSV